ncbi:MAG: peptide ABC transporter permease [Phycisphaeraceae bacterium]|nr:peptide ABC transporter permease [Phycisphaeraceae bacterium]
MTDDATTDQDRTLIASQWRLVWWRFRRHRVALFSSVIVALFVLVAILADFLASGSPHDTHAHLAYLPPQPIFWFDEGAWSPHVLGVGSRRDPETLDLVFEIDPNEKIPVTFFAQGPSYHLLGVIPTDRHLLGIEGHPQRTNVFLLGADRIGRDLWSRLAVGTRTSMSIGLVGVVISLVIGIWLGGLSGYYGGWVDNAIQRLIEFFRSIPTIPLWMGLAAALPPEWSVKQRYFALTLILSLIAWTELARVIRGRFLSLREDDFVAAARVAGCSEGRIIFRHMVPAMISHIIAATTLAIPAMIISETALSFLGLGLRAPAVSWGVLLKEAQNVQAIALYPWMLLPAIPVIIAVLAFNFVGDGLRDAADPYAA